MTCWLEVGALMNSGLDLSCGTLNKSAFIPLDAAVGAGG